MNPKSTLLAGGSGREREERREGQPPCCTHHDKAHLAHGLLVVVVHLADQRVAQVHGDALDRLVLPRGVEDAEQELVDAAVLELQLLRDAEVAERQAAVPLDLGEARRQAEHSQGRPWKLDPRVSLEVWGRPELWQSRKAFWKETKRPFIFFNMKKKVNYNIQSRGREIPRYSFASNY